MKCKNCKKEGAYLRFRTNEIVCRNCGHIEKIKKEKPSNVSD